MNLEVALKHLKKFRQHFADLNDLNTLVINAHFLGMSLCLVVIGEDSCSRSCEFKSRHRKLDG